MKIYKEFDVDKSVISNFIYSQNGTLATAIKELIMNGIDKGSSTIEIKIDSKRFEVIDHGTGFESREYIEKFFGCFGTPHAEGDAKFGIFRIGRGQIMKFGKITWHSHEFKMHTDIETKGQGYELEENKEDYFDGCIVSGDLYKDLSVYNLNEVIDDLESFVCYLSETVIINKKVASKGESEVEWDHEDDHVKAVWKNNGDGIRIYSQGIYVKTLNAYRYGSLHGDIISKKALSLNMARNELSDDDEAWIYISKIIREKANAEAKKKIKSRKIDELSRIMLIGQLKTNQISLHDVLDSGLIKDYKGLSISPYAFSSSKLPITLLKKGFEQQADAISFQKTATIFTIEEINLWGCNDLSSFIKTLERIFLNERMRFRNIPEILNIEDLSKGIDSSVKIYKNSELTNREAAARDALSKGSKVIARELNKAVGFESPERKVLIGKCISSRAWTDGISYVAIEKRELKWLERGIEGAIEIAMILIHEYVHNNSNIETNEHDLVFYENFHHIILNLQSMIAGKASNAIFKEFHRSLIKRNEKLPVKSIRELPMEVIRGTSEFEGTHEGGSPISLISEIMLKESGVNYSISNKKIKVISSHENFYKRKVGKRIVSKLLEIAKEEGFVKKEINEIIEDEREFYKRDKKETMDCLIAWSIEKGHDQKLIKEILSNKTIYLERILYLICLDENSNVVYFSKETQTLKTVDVTKNGSFSRFGFEDWLNKKIIPSAEEISKDKEQVKYKILAEINKIMEKVEDSELRETIKKDLLTEESMLKSARFY